MKVDGINLRGMRGAMNCKAAEMLQEYCDYNARGQQRKIEFFYQGIDQETTCPDRRTCLDTFSCPAIGLLHQEDNFALSHHATRLVFAWWVGVSVVQVSCRRSFRSGGPKIRHFRSL